MSLPFLCFSKPRRFEQPRRVNLPTRRYDLASLDRQPQAPYPHIVCLAPTRLTGRDIQGGKIPTPPVPQPLNWV
jgi:hypothetical protein